MPALAPLGAADVPFSFEPYRYAKGKVVLRKPANGDGFKSRIDRLAEAMGARYVGRARGYVLSQSAAKKMTAHYLAGSDANAFTGELIGQAQLALF
jgi:hypothetical protein